MTKSERTKQYIIEKTAPLFNKNGFEGTSLTDLLNVTGLTKGSLYGNFRDKEHIAAEAFRFSMEKVRSMIRGRITPEMNAREKLISLLSFYAEYVFDPPIPGGCPLLNHAVEADDGNRTMKKVVAREIENTISFIASLIDEGKKNREFRGNVRSRDLAFVLFSSVEGALMVSRVSSSDAAMKAVVKNCKNILDQISL